MICQRCTKNVEGIHTCSPSELVRKLLKDLDTEKLAALAWAGKLHAAEQQRDDLLAELEELVKEVLARNDCRPFPKYVLPAQDAIAKVKEQK